MMIGVVGGLIVAMLLSIVMSFVLVMCGIDPFVNADEESSNSSTTVENQKFSS